MNQISAKPTNTVHSLSPSFKPIQAQIRIGQYLNRFFASRLYTENGLQKYVKFIFAQQNQISLHNFDSVVT